jgi:hypothetical protein
MLNFEGVKRWLDRAQEMRLEAETVLNPAVKSTLLDIARSYERLAEQARIHPPPLPARTSADLGEDIDNNHAG